jgi:hypothetical protein
LKTGLYINVTAILTLAVIGGCDWRLDNPSDSSAREFTVKSEATISVIDKGPYYQFDTVSFSGGITSQPVEDSSLVKKYDWDFGNDGTYDTTLYNSAVLKIPLYKQGTYTVSIKLTDDLGNTSRAVASLNVQPRFKADEVLFPDTHNNPDINFQLDTTCAFYSQSQYTMKPVVLLGRYLTYRNKTESMNLGSFVFELLKNLTGTIDYRSLSLPYRKGFKNGVYTLQNDSLTMDAVFLWGSTSTGHNENDTIRYDLFAISSYIKSFNVTLNTPYYTYEKGPLWDLTSGFSVDVSNPLKPSYSFNIDLRELKFAGFRNVNSRYTMTAQMDQNNQITEPTFDAIAFKYHGQARIEPFHIKDIVPITQKDSFQIDMTGSEIVSDSFPINFYINNGTDTSAVKYNFMIDQLILDQIVFFGNSGGNRKVAGYYKARSQLSVDRYSLVNTFFAGIYSTVNADTAAFFCDQEMSSQFGGLYFDKPQSGYSTFISDRYGYQFVMKDGEIK